jgi:hypothetical protein
MSSSNFFNSRIFYFFKSTGCPKIRKFRIQSVVGDHFSRPNMEIKKKKSGLPPQRCLLLFMVYIIVENINLKQFFDK